MDDFFIVIAVISCLVLEHHNYILNNRYKCFEKPVMNKYFVQYGGIFNVSVKVPKSNKKY